MSGRGARAHAGLVLAASLVTATGWAQRTERVSLTASGAQANGGSGYAFPPSISADGRYVAFESLASNLVAGDTNGRVDVFLRDRQGGTTERVSVATGGAQGDSWSAAPSISADGRRVAFRSPATNFVAGATIVYAQIFLRDRQSGTTEQVSVASDGTYGNSDTYAASISADGRYVAFGSISTNLVSGDTNSWADVFVRDLRSGTTERVSVATNGSQ